jgi:hypothetical protein
VVLFYPQEVCDFFPLLPWGSLFTLVLLAFFSRLLVMIRNPAVYSYSSLCVYSFSDSVFHFFYYMLHINDALIISTFRK